MDSRIQIRLTDVQSILCPELLLLWLIGFRRSLAFRDAKFIIIASAPGQTTTHEHIVSLYRPLDDSKKTNCVHSFDPVEFVLSRMSAAEIKPASSCSWTLIAAPLSYNIDLVLPRQSHTYCARLAQSLNCFWLLRSEGEIVGHGYQDGGCRQSA